MNGLDFEAQQLVFAPPLNGLIRPRLSVTHGEIIIDKANMNKTSDCSLIYSVIITITFCDHHTVMDEMDDALMHPRVQVGCNVGPM